MASDLALPGRLIDLQAVTQNAVRPTGPKAESIGMERLVASLEASLDDVVDFRSAARAVNGLGGEDDGANALREAFRLHMSDGECVPDAELYRGLDSIEPPVVVLWLAALEVARHPVLVARLGDLCWLRRAAGRPDLPARYALRAFMELLDCSGSKVSLRPLRRSG